jgi:hypothetical protein
MGHIEDLLARIRNGTDESIIKALDELLPRWISVSEKLPEEDEDVVVFTDEQGERGIHVASVDEDGIWCPSHGDGWMFPTVTHWMPLPAPPTDGK